VVEGRGRGPTDTVAAENFEFEISSDTDDICLFLYIINTLWFYLAVRVKSAENKVVISGNTV
jgi:hypothetical protein